MLGAAYAGGVASDLAADDLAGDQSVARVGDDDVPSGAAPHDVAPAVGGDGDAVVPREARDRVLDPRANERVGTRGALDPRRRSRSGGDKRRQESGSETRHLSYPMPSAGGCSIRAVTGLRRLSHAISEGEGISLLVQVSDREAARAAESQRADGLVVHGAGKRGLGEIRAATNLPILFYFDGERADELAGVDACVVDVTENRDDEWWGRAHRELSEFELAYRVQDEDELEWLLEAADAEVIVLSAAEAQSDQTAVERVLELLPDVPAGKLAIAELPRASRDDVAELERAGVDAVLVGSGDVGGLVDEPPPEV